MSLLGSELVDQIDQRICNMMGIDAADSEPMQAQWYEIGEEYKAHVDYFEPDMLQYSKYGEEKGSASGQAITLSPLIFMESGST